MGRFDGKVALVTGGASGMGAADCKLFVEEGAKVVIADLNEEIGGELANELGDNAIFVKLNVADEQDWKDAIAATNEAFGRLDILVNNAGILQMTGVEDTTLEQFQKIMAVNVDGVFLGMKYAIPEIRKQGGGAIINMSSTAGLEGQVSATGYVASKWAVRGMTKTVAADVADENIRINSVHPGAIATPMTADSPCGGCTASARGSEPSGPRRGGCEDGAVPRVRRRVLHQRRRDCCRRRPDPGCLQAHLRHPRPARCPAVTAVVAVAAIVGKPR